MLSRPGRFLFAILCIVTLLPALVYAERVAFVARLSGDGKLDTTFGTDGFTIVNWTASSP